MIDPNKIRSLNVLEEMKTVLTDFLNHNQQDLLAVYDAAGDGEEDLDADREAAQTLLVKIERRMKSLGNHLARASAEVQAESHSHKMESDTSSVT